MTCLMRKQSYTGFILLVSPLQQRHQQRYPWSPSSKTPQTRSLRDEETRLDAPISSSRTVVHGLPQCCLCPASLSAEAGGTDKIGKKSYDQSFIQHIQQLIHSLFKPSILAPRIPSLHEGYRSLNRSYITDDTLSRSWRFHLLPNSCHMSSTTCPLLHASSNTNSQINPRLILTCRIQALPTKTFIRSGKKTPNNNQIIMQIASVERSCVKHGRRSRFWRGWQLVRKYSSWGLLKRRGLRGAILGRKLKVLVWSGHDLVCRTRFQSEPIR